MGLRKGIYDGFFVMANLSHFPGPAQLVNNKVINSLTGFLGKPNPFIRFQNWSMGKIQSRMENTNSSEREDMLAHFIRMKNDKGDQASFPVVLIEAMNSM